MVLKRFRETILILGKVLEGHKYAIRGTASLMLQGIEMNVDDIDILCDKKTVLASNKILKDYLVKKVKYSESGKHKSYFGEFNINSIKVEVMGEWQIKKADGQWSTVYCGEDRKEINIDGQGVWVTTIDSELEIFALMGRWSAYHKIKKQLLDKHQPSLLQ